MPIKLTTTTPEENQLLSMFGAVENVELYKADRGSHKFSIGERCELFGLEQYPSLNGEIVTISNYRDSMGGENAYYIESESGNVEPHLNFVYEKRLRVVPKVAEGCDDA